MRHKVSRTHTRDRKNLSEKPCRLQYYRQKNQEAVQEYVATVLRARACMRTAVLENRKLKFGLPNGMFDVLNSCSIHHICSQ
jgi:hypothetical protein